MQSLLYVGISLHCLSGGAKKAALLKKKNDSVSNPDEAEAISSITYVAAFAGWVDVQGTNDTPDVVLVQESQKCQQQYR